MLVGTGGAAAGEIGIGAILGAPFLLATLALFVVGSAALGYRGSRKTGEEIMADRQTAIPDLAFFIVCFTLAAAAGIVALPLVLKLLVALILLAVYAFYVVWTVKKATVLNVKCYPVAGPNGGKPRRPGMHAGLQCPRPCRTPKEGAV